MVVSKKNSKSWHIPRSNGLHKKFPNFLFFHYLFSSLADLISAEPSPENLQLMGFMIVQVLDILKIYI